MPNYNQEEALKLAKTCNEPTEPERKGFKKITRRIEDETEIIEKLKNPIAENGEFFTDIPLHQQKEIKNKVISDVFHLLFGCTETCPLCDVPFDETHLGQLDLDSQHCSRCHRPTGFARYTPNKGDTFITSTCNDFVQSDHTFQTLTQIMSLSITRTTRRSMIITNLGIFMVGQVRIPFIGNTLHIRFQRISIIFFCSKNPKN